MQDKLFDSEAKVMEIIWEKSPISAKDISLIAADTIGWNKNTTYTVIKKLEAKGFIRREDPGFICTPLVSQNEMQKVEAASLIKKVFGGSRKALFSALLEDEPLSEEEINEFCCIPRSLYPCLLYCFLERWQHSGVPFICGVNDGVLYPVWCNCWRVRWLVPFGKSKTHIGLASCDFGIRNDTSDVYWRNVSP